MSREQIERPAEREQEKPAEVAEPKDLSNKDLAKSTDDVIDEIDDLLEETLKGTDALTWVSGFIQRGGE